MILQRNIFLLMQTTEVKITKVVACVLKKKNFFLITSRPLKKTYSGFYEFPGGKVERNEFHLEALKRELLEELSIKININKLIFLKSYPVIRRKKIGILNNLFKCTNGIIKPLENQEIRWIKLENIRDYKVLVSNKKIIDLLGSLFLFPAT